MDEQTTQVGPGPALPEAGRLEAGAILGDLQLTRLAGEGQSSIIFQASNLLLGKRCAVKLLRPGVAAGPVVRGRARHEAQQVDQLGVAGIGATFGYGLAPDGHTHYVAQEWVDGSPLRDLLAHHGALSRRAYLPLVRQLCQLLATTHAAGVAHLALHGGNVLIAQRSNAPAEVKLLDFGIHHLHPPPVEQSPDLVRRPEHAFYLAPEQVKGQVGDSRTDVYALCALLYEMVTGRPPFMGQTYAETLERILADAPHAPAGLASVPPELEATLLRGLDKEPGRRIPSVEALLAALDPLSATTGQHPALVRSPSMERRLTDFTPGARPEQEELTARNAASEVLRAPRKRLPLLIVLGVVLLAGLGTGLYLLLSKSKSQAQDKAPVARARPPRRPIRAQRPPPPRRPLQMPKPGARRRGPAKAAVDRETPAGLRRPERAPRRLRVPAARLATARRITGQGTIKILTGNPTAKIFLDGRYVGSGSLKTLRRIPAGKHRLHIELDQKKMPPKDIVLKPGASLELTL